MSTDYRFPSPEELARIEFEARRLRARAVADAVRFLRRGLGRALARVATRRPQPRAAH
jgi:hypothetical protein